jgi:D-galactarolactone cycloisomerase
MNSQDAAGPMEESSSSAKQAKITGIRIHSLSGPLSERFGWSLNWTQSRTATIVEVTTDAGLTGWGDGTCDAALLAERADSVIGRSPLEVEAIYEELRRPGGPQQRPGAPAAPGLDLALWDLRGKILDLPISSLLGKQHRSHVTPYLTSMYRKDWPDFAQGMADEAQQWVAKGYRAIKMKTGFSPMLDVEIATAVRKAIGPDIALGIDSNCAYDSGTAIRIGARLEELDLMWWEEPLPADDVEGYRRMRQALRIPLAAGETGSADWLTLNYIQPGLVDILQPDLEHIGLTGARMITQLCWLNRIRLVPHNWGTALRTAATLHWMSTCPPLTPAIHPPEILFEFDQTEHPFRDAILAEKLAPVSAGGGIAVPQGSGLGVTVLPHMVEKYRTRLVTIGNPR